MNQTFRGSIGLTHLAWKSERHAILRFFLWHSRRWGAVTTFDPESQQPTRRGIDFICNIERQPGDVMLFEALAEMKEAGLLIVRDIFDVMFQLNMREMHWEDYTSAGRKPRRFLVVTHSYLARGIVRPCPFRDAPTPVAQGAGALNQDPEPTSSFELNENPSRRALRAP